MKITVQHIGDGETLKTKTTVKKTPIDRHETRNAVSQSPEPEPAELEPVQQTSAVATISFAQRAYHRASIPRIPPPKIADISLGARMIILVSAIALIVIGAQSLLVEYDNKLWNMLLTSFNAGIVALGLILVALYLIPKKRRHKIIR